VKEELVKIIPEAWVMLSPLFAVIVTWLSVQLHRLINAHVTSANYKTASTKIVDLATAKVLEGNQRIADALRDPTKPGVLDDVTAARLRDEAVNFVMSMLPDAKKIATDLGIAEVERLREYVANSVEAAVRESKRVPVGEAIIVEPGAVADKVTR
jgi:hypothetical protein